MKKYIKFLENKEALVLDKQNNIFEEILSFFMQLYSRPRECP